MASVSASDGYLSTIGTVTISVGSPLACNIKEAKADEGEKGKVKGKVNFKANFTYTGRPDPTDYIVVSFDGITLISVPFSSFKEDSDDPGEFKFKDKNLHMKIDFNKRAIKISRHKMVLANVNNSNGIDVVIYFGNATCTDHFVMKDDDEDHNEDHDKDHKKKMSHKEKDDD